MKNKVVNTHGIQQILSEISSRLEEAHSIVKAKDKKLPLTYDFMTDPRDYLAALVAIDIVGVWDSELHGVILWLRLNSAYPVYSPICQLSETGEANFISLSSYRAVFLDLNNALLQGEGFE